MKTNIWKVLSLVFLGFFLLIAILIIISIIDHYRFINDNRVMDMIKEEMKDPASKENDQILIKLGTYIGMTEEEVVRNLGNPEELGNWKGADYSSYSNKASILLYWNNDDEAKVTGISYFGNEKVDGISCGMEAKEVINILGEPINRGIDEGYTPPEAYMTYIRDNIELPNMESVVNLEVIYYFAGENGPITYIDILTSK